MPFDKTADESNALSWELDPSTRENTHIWTKWAPVDVTLNTTNVAEDLFNVSTELPVVNLITNPSMELGDPPTGYTAVGATIAQSATVARTGVESLSIDPDNSVAGEGAYWTTESLGGGADKPSHIITSIYLQDNADVGRTARIEIRDSTGVTTHSAGTEITLSSSWQRSVASFQLPANAGATYRIYVVTSTSASDEIFYADDFQLEIGRYSTVRAYCDGEQGLNHEWDGAANASTSRRRLGLVAIRGYTLHTTHDLLISFDHTSSSTTGMRVLAGTDFWTDFPIHIRSRISIINAVSGETPRVFGSIWGVHTMKT